MKVSKNRLGFWQGYFNRKAAASGRTTHKMTASGWFAPKKHKSAPSRFIQMGINFASRKFF